MVISTESVRPAGGVSLEETLWALARLDGEIARARGRDAFGSGVPEFSAAALDRLQGVVQRGAEELARRSRELGGEGSWSEASRGKQLSPGRLPRPDRAAIEGSNPVKAARSRSLLFTYRTACRRVCACWRDAHGTADRKTAAILSGLLHRLEKQLWLLDSSPQNVRIGLPTINRFLSC